MKYITSLLFGLSIFSCVSAQQIDNALLLDYYQNQKFSDAYSYLRTAYPEPVTDMRALGNLAYTAQMSGNLPDAEGYYQRLYDKDSTNVSVLFNLGAINLKRRNNAKAIGYYQKILQRDSNNFMVNKQLADLYFTDSVNYQKYLQKANSINPVDADVASDLGLLFVALGKFDKASVVVGAALRADTANLELMLVLVDISYMQKNYPQTIILCNKLIDAGNSNAKVINRLASSYYKTAKYSLCISTFAKLSSIAQNEGTYFYTAMSYKALKDQANAIVYFKKALVEAISPNTTDYYIDLGDSYDNLGQIKMSIASYQKSLQFIEKPLAYYSLAYEYDLRLKDRSNALKYYKKYLSAKPDEGEEKKFIDYANSRIAELGAKPAK